MFRAVRDLMENEQKMTTLVADFEVGAWQAVRSVFPDTLIKGCTFHFSQAVWRSRVQETDGLIREYGNRNDIYKLIRRLFALPFLPHQFIGGEFERLERRAGRHDLLASLFEYVSDNWINSTIWPPENWSVYRRPIRTNNDVEGYHRRINGIAGRPKLEFYVMVQLLKEECQLANIQLELIRDNRLKKIQRRKYVQLQAKIFDAWDDYDNGQITAAGLLRRCSYVYMPV